MARRAVAPPAAPARVEDPLGAALIMAAPARAAPLELGEEVEYSLGQQRGRVRVVRRQRAVGKQMPVAGIQEQLRVLRFLDERARSVDVSFSGEERVLIHPVDLDRYVVRPGSAEF